MWPLRRARTTVGDPHDRLAASSPADLADRGTSTPDEPLMADALEALLHAGRIGRPHGLDGSFHVTRPQPALLDLGRTLVVDGGPRAIVRRAGTDAAPILKLAGCDSRSAVEALRGTDLLVPREEAPALEEDEFWPEELEGCTVHDGAREVGAVRRLLGLPSCEVLEVARPDAPDLLVPLIQDAVRTVDVSARRIEIDLAFLGETAEAE